MNEYFVAYAQGAAVLCGIMAIVSLGRRKRFGNGAFFLVGAFVAMGLLMVTFGLRGPMPLLVLLGLAVFGLLVGDALMRFKA